MVNSFALLANYVTRKPGVIVGPIAKVLGVCYDALFNIIYSISPVYSLGIAIILFTLIIKLVLTPLTIKQQKSMLQTQKLQPEMNKIKKKYEGKKDPASQQKMAMEMQKLQKDSGVSMFGGCLPLLIQLPILYAIFYIFQQPHNYVGVVNDIYTQVANILMSVPVDTRITALTDVIMAKGLTIDVASAEDLKVLMSTLSSADWGTITSALGGYADQITPFVSQLHEIEYFFGVSLVSKVTFSFPGILIPILAGVTTYLQTKIMMNRQKSAPVGDDPMSAQMDTMNKSMQFTMPVMMGVICFISPAALGIYWTASNIIQTIQSYVINRYYTKKEEA